MKKIIVIFFILLPFLSYSQEGDTIMPLPFHFNVLGISVGEENNQVVFEYLNYGGVINIDVLNKKVYIDKQEINFDSITIVQAGFDDLTIYILKMINKEGSFKIIYENYWSNPISASLNDADGIYTFDKKNQTND